MKCSVDISLSGKRSDVTTCFPLFFSFFILVVFFSCFCLFVCLFVCFFFLRNESINSIVMTTQVWVVILIHHHYGITGLVLKTSFRVETSFFQDKKVGHFVRLKHRQISYLCIGHTEVGPVGDWVRKLCEKMLLNTRKRNPG